MVDNGKLIDDQAFHALQHPLQRRRFVLALIFALLLFPLIAVGLIFGTIVLIVPLGGVLLWITGRVLFAHFLGNSILASNLNYPRIYLIGEELKTRIGYKKTVNIFVYEQGNFNAFLMKFIFYRKAVFLNSELLESGVTDDELRWLVGRFIGYLRAVRQAGFWGWTIRAAQKLVIFNIFLLPYERALVYTGDRLALAVIDGDISCAISVMQKLFVGRQLGYSVNPEGIIDQQRLVKGSVFAFLARIATGFPHMTTRYVDLIVFAKSYYPAQYARFEAGNPGVPGDVLSLGAVSRPSSALWMVSAAVAAVLIIGAAGWYFAGHRPVVPQTAPPTPSDADKRQEEALAAQHFKPIKILPASAKLLFKKGELYYTAPVTVNEAQAVGEALVASEYFRDDTERSVYLSQDQAGYELQFVYDPARVDNPLAAIQFAVMGNEIARDALGGKPIKVTLTDDHFKPIKILPASAKLLFKKGELYYTAPVTVEEAQAVGEELVTSEIFRDDKETTVHLSREEDTYQLKFVINPSRASDPEIHDAFKELTRAIATRALGGQPVVVHLCDNELRTLTRERVE